MNTSRLFWYIINNFHFRKIIFSFIIMGILVIIDNINNMADVYFIALILGFIVFCFSICIWQRGGLLRFSHTDERTVISNIVLLAALPLLFQEIHYNVSNPTIFKIVITSQYNEIKNLKTEQLENIQNIHKNDIANFFLNKTIKNKILEELLARKKINARDKLFEELLFREIVKRIEK